LGEGLRGQCRDEHREDASVTAFPRQPRGSSAPPAHCGHPDPKSDQRVHPELLIADAGRGGNEATTLLLAQTRQPGTKPGQRASPVVLVANAERGGNDVFATARTGESQRRSQVVDNSGSRALAKT
jgi:hypothetical protein